MPALVTPFTDAGDVDLDAHGHNLRTLREMGAAGFLIGGSNGEGPYLETGERRALLTAAREELGDDPFLVCGITAQSLRQAAAQVTEAHDGGADAVLVLTPTSLILGDDVAVRGFYEELAASAPLPVLLYSFRRRTGYELPVDIAGSLLDHANIVGMKDSDGQPLRFHQLASSEERFLFAGASRALALSVVAGAHGAITASGNYAPSLVREVVAGARKSLRKATDPQERLTGLTRIVEARGLAGTKIAAEIAGLRPGAMRRPLRPLEDAEAEQLRRSVAALRLQLLG